MNAGSMLDRRLLDRITKPACVSSSYSRWLVSVLAWRFVGILDVGGRAKMASAPSKISTAPAARARANTADRFLVVSPTYLLVVEARLTTSRLTPSSRAITCLAIDLPTVGGPEKGFGTRDPGPEGNVQEPASEETS